MEGWIKINRAITSHWLWSDAERLKWWLDLLLLANWEENKVMCDSHLITLKQGQILASTSYLAKRWKRNRKTIIQFLNLLTNDGIIERTIVGRKTAIITICNYVKYQCSADTLTDTITDILTDTIADTIADTNKEYKEYVDVDNNAHTREEENIFDIFNDESWVESMEMRWKTDKAALLSQFNEFVQDMKCRGKEGHKDVRDLKQHFNNWLLRRNGSEQHTTRKRAAQRKARRATDADFAARSDYEGAF